MKRRRGLIAGAVSVAVLAGYVALDIADVAPGALTATPQPLPSPPYRFAVETVPPVAKPAELSTGAVTAPGLSRALDAKLADPNSPAGRIATHMSVVVADAHTGEVLYQREPNALRQPASVAKLATALAVLKAVGANTVLQTRAHISDDGAVVTVSGAGDVLMGAGASDPNVVNGRAGLGTLADRTVEALAARGSKTVTVVLDDSRAPGPAVNPAWSPGDLTTGYTAPLTSVAVNVGRKTAEPVSARHPDPGLHALDVFAKALAAKGISVAPSRARGAALGPAVAAVDSAPMHEVVTYVVRTSDNTATDSLARLVAVQRNEPTDFAGSGQAVLNQIRDMGINITGAALQDGSGLARGSTLSAVTVLQILRSAAIADGGALRSVLTGLPVAGLHGTMAARMSAAPVARGLVRAKTGTLSSSAALAGTVQPEGGQALLFVVMADQLTSGVDARVGLDDFVSTMVRCGCA